MKGPPGILQALGAVARRPGLWPIAVVMALRLARRGWWRRWPPLPYPDPAYWRLRMTVAYGGEGDRPPEGEDVASYLRWCRANWRRSHAARG